MQTFIRQPDGVILDLNFFFYKKNFSVLNLLSPFTSSLLLRPSKSPLDPSQFQQFLQGVFTTSGKPNLTSHFFYRKTQQRFYLVFLKSFVWNLYMHCIFCLSLIELERFVSYDNQVLKNIKHKFSALLTFLCQFNTMK